MQYADKSGLVKNILEKSLTVKPVGRGSTMLTPP